MRVTIAIQMVCALFYSQVSGQSAPELTITKAEADSLFGSNPAKMILHYDSPALTYPDGAVGPLYLVDFSADTLILQQICDDVQSWIGDPFISPDGTRILYNNGGRIYIRMIKPLGANKTIVSDSGFDQRWWIHPETRDEYIIFSNTRFNNSGLIAGKTFLQKINKGTCAPEGSRLILSDTCAFNSGRTPSGRFIHGAQPGNHFGDLVADSLAIENAKITILWHTDNRCNGSISQDPARPYDFLWAPLDHSYISYGMDSGRIDHPSGYAISDREEWSTHPDFITATMWEQYPGNVPGRAEAFIFQWSSKKWVKVCKYVLSTHLWVENRSEAPAIYPAIGSRTFSNSLEVFITSSKRNAKIYYTTDGSIPANSSNAYTNSINLNKSITINAVSYEPYKEPSSVATATFTKTVYGKLLFPNGGEIFYPGDIVNIQWETFDKLHFSDAIIKVSLDKGMTWHIIVDKAIIMPAESTIVSFAWIIPDSLGGKPMKSSNAQMCIEQYQGDIADFSDSLFQIGSLSHAKHPMNNAAKRATCFFMPIISKLAIDLGGSACNYAACISFIDGRLYKSYKGYATRRYLLVNVSTPGIYIVWLRLNNKQYQWKIPIFK